MSRMSFNQDQLGQRQGFGQPQNQGGQQVMRGAPPAQSYRTEQTQPQQQTGGGFSGGGYGGYGGGSMPLPDPTGAQLGGRTTAGDLSYEAPDSTGVLQSLYDAIARMNVAGTQAGAGVRQSELQSMSQDLASRLGLEGIQSQVGGGNYQSDNQLEASRYNSDAQVTQSGNQLEGLKYGVDADERNTDMTSGRQLEGVRYGVDGNVDIANIGANSARDVANISNERWRLEDGQFDDKMSRYDQAFASLQGSGFGGESLPSGTYQQGDETESLNRAYAQSAADRASMENQVANSGGSPQASAYGARAAQMEAATNAASSYEIPQAFRQENNGNRFAELAARAEARRAQNDGQGNLLGFLSQLIG